ncbi:MAG: hypothetical protein MUF54_13530 [Polyangiaceae bacterium]|nr:hypothetical protein [Polyangiaceae bacterium]
MRQALWSACSATPLTERLPRPNLARFQLSAADSRVVLGALWSLDPRSFATGQEFDRQDLSEAIRESGTVAEVATRLVTREPATHRAWAANRIFWLDADPPNGDLLPRKSDVALRQRVLCSHALSLELVDLYATGQVEAFLKGRQEVMEGVVRTFLDGMAETAFEDTPPLDSLDLDEDEDAPRDGT